MKQEIISLKYEQLTSAGGVVFRLSYGTPRFLLLGFKRRKTWCLPKGLIEKGEGELEAAKREVEEETGISQLRLIDKIGAISYEFWLRGRRYHKTVHFFLFETEQEYARVSREHDRCAWFNFEEAVRISTYLKEKEMLKKGYAIILNMLNSLEVSKVKD